MRTGGRVPPLQGPCIALPRAALHRATRGRQKRENPQNRVYERHAYAPRLRTYTQPAQFFSAGEQLAAHTQPALRTGPMAPSGRLLHVSRSQVKNYSPGYMGQAPSRGHDASPQSGLGVGCKRCSSSKKLRGLGVRAQARCISISLSFSVVGVSSFLPPLRSAMRRGAWKCNTGPR